MSLPVDNRAEPSSSALNASRDTIHPNHVRNLGKTVATRNREGIVARETTRASPDVLGSRWSVSAYYNARLQLYWCPGDVRILETAVADVRDFGTASPLAQEPPSLIWKQTMGTGRYGIIHACKCKTGKKLDDYIAVKELPYQSKNERTRAEKELNLLRTMKHKHIVAYIGGYRFLQPSSKPKLCIMVYPLAMCNLNDFLLKQFWPKTTEDLREDPGITCLKRYFGCICHSLNYLHTQDIKHRDIKPENILVDRFYNMLLTDFGVSKQYDGSVAMRSSGPADCTIEYSAPEPTREGVFSDIFSLGCVFLEMASVILGETLENLYTQIETSAKNDRKVVYWQSVAEKKVDGWVTKLKAKLSSQHEGIAEEMSSSAKYIQESHLDIILEMMSSNPKARPPLTKVRDAFESLRDGCEECSDPIPAQVSASTDGSRASPELTKTSSRTNKPGLSSNESTTVQPSVDTPPIANGGITPSMAGEYIEVPATENPPKKNTELPRVWKPGKGVTTLTSPHSIPGKYVIDYDPETARGVPVLKSHLDFKSGILMRLPHGDGVNFNTVVGFVNLWKRLSLPTNMKRVVGKIRMIYLRGNYPDDMLLNISM